MARTYGGRQTPNIAGLGGKVLTQVVSRTYYPPSATSFPVLATKFSYSVMRDVMFSAIREFYPDAAAHFIRKHREKMARAGCAERHLRSLENQASSPPLLESRRIAFFANLPEVCLAPQIRSAARAAHLRPEGLAFLRNLARNNDREWFTPRKAVYEAELKEPMLAIIRKVTDAMMDFAPAFVRPAEKCLFRIYRDTRFSANKLPYKTHVAAWWSHQGLEKTSGAGYYFHISAKEVVVAAGAYMPEKDQLAAIRHWLLDHHAEFRKLLQKPAVRKTFSRI